MTAVPTYSVPQPPSRKAVTTVAAFRDELLRLCARGGRPLTVEEMSRRTGRPPTLFRHFLRGGSTLPEWQTVQAVLTATGETSPQAITAWKRRWAALERDSGGRAAELARRHKSRRKARLPTAGSTRVYDDPGTYATDTSGASWAVGTPTEVGRRPVEGGPAVDSPLNNAVAATDAAGYVAALAKLAEAVSLSYAQIAARSGGGLSKSSAHRIATGHGTGDLLPAKRSTLAAYLAGCGVVPLEQRLWLHVWDQLRRTRPARGTPPQRAREVVDRVMDRQADVHQALPAWIVPPETVMVPVDHRVLAAEVHRTPVPSRRRGLLRLRLPRTGREGSDRRGADAGNGWGGERRRGHRPTPPGRGG